MYLIFKKTIKFVHNKNNNFKISKRNYLKLDDNGLPLFDNNKNIVKFKTHELADSFIKRFNLTHCHIELIDNLNYAVI